MKENVFRYLAAERMKSAFREWWQSAYPHETVPSYRTILRAGIRWQQGEPLTSSQERALERAQEFKETLLPETAAAA